MKKNIYFLFAVLMGFTVACSSPEKMAEMAENVTVKCEPAVLEVIGGVIDATVSVTYPEDYFHPKAILEVTPVIVYEGGEVKMKPFMFQGEKVQDNHQVVPSAGTTVTKKVKFDFKPGMENCYLELRGVVSHKSTSTNVPTKKVADGAIVTYMLVNQDGKLDMKADNYNEIIKETAEGQILYQINSANVRNSELKSASIKEYQETLSEVLADDRKTIVSTDIIAYASPDGKEEENAKLSDSRSKSAEKAYGSVTKGIDVDAPVNISSIAEDWEGFQELVAASDIEDKELIIRVLSMYSDPAVREKEIRNMSAVYSTLAQEVLPELRRARFIANVEYRNYSSEELLQLIEENVDVLDESALLRAATLVEDDEQKIEIYKKAVEKYDSATARYNMAVTYIGMGKLNQAENALEGLDQDSDWCNAMGVISLRNGNLDAAAEYFAIAESETSKENAAVIDIIDGAYQDAAAKLAGKEGYNAALIQLLNGNYSAAAAFEGDCPEAAYLRAVAAARQGDAEGVKKNLEIVNQDKELAAKAAKDVEFVKYR